MLLRVLTYSCLLFLIVFSIGLSFAADVPAVYVPKSYQDTPVSCVIEYGGSRLSSSVACAALIKTITPTVDYEKRYFSSFVSSPNFVPGVNSSARAIYCMSGGSACVTININYWGANAGYTESYSCPPPGYPDNIISNGTMCSQKICSDVGTYGGFYGYSKMPNGSGTACYMGCKYEVFKPSTEQSTSGYGWYFYGGRTNGTEGKGACKCPDGSVTCWTNNFSADGSGSSATDKTCTAYDNGELKGVNCGENGSMSVDVGAIQEAIFNTDAKVTALDENQKAMAAVMRDESLAIGELKSDVADLKSKGCSVSQGLNGVSITCNGQTATATNGKDGVDGKNGVDGVNGARGAQGVAGADGKDGIDGVNGARGADGKDGAQGVAGVDGKDGAQGVAGVDGKDGAQGVAGVDGKDGAQGVAGVDGKDGVQGVAGVDGKDGAQGVAGVDGKDGEDGLSITAYQDGLDAVVMSSEGVELARVAGVDKDGIIESVDKTTQAISDLSAKFDITPPPGGGDNPYAEIFGQSFRDDIKAKTESAQEELLKVIDEARDVFKYENLSATGSFDTNVEDIMGASVDLSGRRLYDVLADNGIAAMVMFLAAVVGFGIIMRSK